MKFDIFLKELQFLALSQGSATNNVESRQLIVRRNNLPVAKKQLPQVPKEEEEAVGPGRPPSGIERSGSSTSADRVSAAASPNNGTTAAYGQFYLEYALMAE